MTQQESEISNQPGDSHSPDVWVPRTNEFQYPIEDYQVFRRRPDLLPQVDTHLRRFCEATGRNDEELSLVRNVLGGYLATRFDRGEELKSDDVNHARKIAQQYFNEVVGDEVFVGFNLCMDRRTRKTLMLGVPGRSGGSLRFPGGVPDGFRRVGLGSDDLFLDPNSSYGKNMATILRSTGHMLQIVDSHIACAARTDLERNKTGMEPEEAGVKADRRFKGKMIAATKAFAEQFGRQTYFVQTSFDPHTGFMYLLDEDNFVDPVISTKELAYGRLAEIFDQHKFEVDWLRDYEKSSLQFWQHMQQMRWSALPVVREELQRVYPHLGKSDPVKFELKCRVAMANAYSGWLNNLGGKYLHDIHNENLVVASSGGEHGPFPDFESFEISRDSTTLREEALFATRLVRYVRAQGNAHGKPSDPVPFIIQARVADRIGRDVQEISDTTAEIVGHLQKRDWRSMSFQDLVLTIRDMSFGSDEPISLDYGIAAAQLVRTLADIYDPTHPFAEYVYSGSIIPVGEIVDDHRSPIAGLNLLPPR
ncbi:MAG: hypothetical protein HYT10_03170 [Candidatus Levybacteria bacterium]|nr:hypothetical protein [Candidatus Levybacteria bacterium]